LLHLDCGLFFEFVRLEEFHDGTPRRYAIHEVETDVRYALVLSSNSGLWTYPVGDVVRFTQLKPHKIVLSGRTAEVLDMYGESVFGDDADDALNTACRKTGASVLHYHITHKPSVPDELPGHQWLIEFDNEPSSMRTFIEHIDQQLKAAGHHYVDRRDCLAFDKPEIVRLPRGTFHRWLESTGKRVTMQSKIPRMLEDRSVADAILNVTGEK
jgi:hypothetical protein